MHKTSKNKEYEIKKEEQGRSLWYDDAFFQKRHFVGGRMGKRSDERCQENIKHYLKNGINHPNQIVMQELLY